MFLLLVWTSPAAVYAILSSILSRYFLVKRDAFVQTIRWWCRCESWVGRRSGGLTIRLSDQVLRHMLPLTRFLVVCLFSDLTLRSSRTRGLTSSESCLLSARHRFIFGFLSKHLQILWTVLVTCLYLCQMGLVLLLWRSICIRILIDNLYHVQIVIMYVHWRGISRRSYLVVILLVCCHHLSIAWLSQVGHISCLWVWWLCVSMRWPSWNPLAQLTLIQIILLLFL